jgi:large subunit ribosomal protein L32e
MSKEASEKPNQKRVLALRERHKAKKPSFRREESWRYKRVSQIWRKPDGVDSKMRKHKKGWPKSVEIGYRGPKVARGLHPSGYVEVPVRTVDDLSKVDPKTQAIRVAHTVGLKKRAEISLRASEMGIHILNPLPEIKPEEASEEEAPKETEAGEAEAEVEEETKETKEKEDKEEEKSS